MRLTIIALVLLLQSTPLPPPYPRDGTTKLFENDRIVVWDVSWLQQAYPVHRHIDDYTVFITRTVTASSFPRVERDRERVPLPV
jgi:hypothetical protein